MRVLNYLISPSRIWAIEEGAWQEMVNIVSRERVSVEAVEARLGKKLDNKVTNAFEVEDGVAIIPVIGPIVRYGGIFSDISGATSVTKITEDFKAALEDDSVKSILFHIDSPGGEANGISELSELIYESRGIKPIESYISGLGCSAAYWIASSTEKVWMDAIAMAGSIGVASVIEDNTAKKENEGTKVYKFVSDGAENKRPDLDTDEGKDIVRKNLNAISKVFRTKVARNRSGETLTLDAEDVINKFGQGSTFVGEEAVKIGLADGLSSYQAVLERLKNNKENIMANKKNNVSEELEGLDNKAISLLESKVITLEAEKQALETSLANAETEKIKLGESLAEVTAKLESLLEEKETLLAKFNTLQDENLRLKAEACAEELKGKIVPAKRDSFIADYILRAKDDASNPVEGTSRVESLVNMWKGADDHHLEDEILETVSLENNLSSEDDDDMEDLLSRAKAFAQNYNSTLKAQR